VKPPTIAIIGPGRMGTAVADLARAARLDVRAMLGRGTPIDRHSLAGADVAIEFTTPASAAANARACVAAGCPVVIGTTGWTDELDAVSAFVRAHDGAMLWAPNFSLGVHALVRLVRLAGSIFAGLPAFDAHLIETHHAAKKDAPSGTAIMIERALAESLGHDVPVTSVRVGKVPGTHELVLDAPFEQLRLVHEARDRRVFAEGALLAARWLVGRHGVFTLDDVMDDTQALKHAAPHTES
jgi:4-hydroxy-tetrahydrodipicolinate reductase